MRCQPRVIVARRSFAELASPVNHLGIMWSTPTESDQDLRPRARTLSWMASMSIAAGALQAAEGYLLELLAWCAFADRDVVSEEL